MSKNRYDDYDDYDFEETPSRRRSRNSGRRKKKEKKAKVVKEKVKATKDKPNKPKKKRTLKAKFFMILAAVLGLVLPFSAILDGHTLMIILMMTVWWKHRLQRFLKW